MTNNETKYSNFKTLKKVINPNSNNKNVHELIHCSRNYLLNWIFKRHCNSQLKKREKLKIN